MSIAYSIERRIEDVVLGLLNLNSEAIEAVSSYGLTTKTAWELDKKVKALGIVVHLHNLANANLAATGGGAYWSATLSLQAGLKIATNQSGDQLNLMQGVCQRFLAGLTPTTLNTALTTATAGITVHGITGTDQPDAEVDPQSEAIYQASAVVLHFQVT